MFSLVEIHKAISCTKCLDLIHAIAAAPNADSSSLRSKTNLTKRQYHLRISIMMKGGLIERNNGKYSLTNFGEVVYYYCKQLQNALKDHWGLKAIDSIKMSYGGEINQEFDKIINALIANYEVKDTLLKVYMKEKASSAV